MGRRPKPSKKVKPGNGKPLKPYRWWQMLWRTPFSIELTDENEKVRRYTVDVDYFDWDVRLYTDGYQSAIASYPVKFPVTGGIIDVNLSLYGSSRMHYVSDDRTETLLRPHPKSLEGRRAAFGRRFPRTSRLIGWTAIVILLVALALFIPQLLERASELDLVAENIGTFTSPIDVPAWLNTTLLVASIIAAFERALTLRNHWLIDADTWWLE